MRNKYDTESRRATVLAEIENLKVHSFMSENNIPTDSRGLQRLFEKVDTLSTQCPPEFRGDSHKARFLRNAVFDAPWSSDPIKKLTSENSSYSKFITDLW